jgi:hypothetical protein
MSLFNLSLMLLYRGSSIGINKRQGKFSPTRFLVCGCANLLACPMLSWRLLWMDENDLQFGFFWYFIVQYIYLIHMIIIVL